MGIVDSFKSFMHSITTEDHYASYDSPYKNSAINNIGNTVGGGNSSSRLHELNRLATANSSSQSLVEGNSNINGSRTSLSRNGSSTTVGYKPGLRSSNTNSSDLQLQNLNASGQPPLPSIDSLWDRIENWLEEEYPELGDNLNDGVTTADLNEFENDLGCGSLPVEVRQFYKRHDGQFRGGKPTGLIMGLTLLDLESIVEEYAIWAKVNQRLEKQQYMYQHQQQQQKRESSSTEASETQDRQKKMNNSFIANQKSIPPNAIQLYYAHRGWIPFAKDFCGNQVAIDLAPGPQGHWGQIIIFGRDYDTKLVIASNLQEFIFGFVTDLELGNFQIDQSDQDGGFLDSSRNDDDYMIGDGEEDQGELCFIDKDKKEFGNTIKGKLTYLDVLKRRALKNFGITNIEKFSTSFTPQRLAQSRPNASGASSPIRAASPSMHGSVKNNKSSNPLINIESTSKVALPKETLIDEEEKIPEESPIDVKQESTEANGAAKNEETVESQVEETVEKVEEKEAKQEDIADETQAKDVQTEVTPSKDDEDNVDETAKEDQDKDSKPLTKSQKKNQNKKAKKQQQKQAQDEKEGVAEIAKDLNEVEL